MIYFVDFEDSFNFNILSYLKDIGDVKIVHFKQFSTILDSISSGDILCLGPGPGHVDEYHHYLDGLNKIYQDKSIFKFGVCLGHQIYLHLCEGLKLVRSNSPQHGQKVKLINSDFLEAGEELYVQRYNSWSVSAEGVNKGNYILDEFGELAAYKHENHMFSVQFHPESIGTSCPDLFFQPLRGFLRYSKEDGFDQASWNLR